jgi:methylase of polypeptide subunit release factors
VEKARGFLEVGGMLIMEMQNDQGAALKELLEGAGWLEGVRVIKDAAVQPRCVVGMRRE